MEATGWREVTNESEDQLREVFAALLAAADFPRDAALFHSASGMR
jgi:hypothetical protein